jgi:Universal stress protein family
LAVESGFDPVSVVDDATGPVAESILVHAERHGVAAIVVGSRGLSASGATILGSVSSRVTQDARHPCSSCGRSRQRAGRGPVVRLLRRIRRRRLRHCDGGQAARASRCDPGVLTARRRRRRRAAVDVALAGQFRSSGPAGGTRPGGGRPSGERGRPWRRDRPARRAGSAQPCRRRRGTRSRRRGGRVGPPDRSRRGRVRLVHRGRAPTVRTRDQSPR